VSLKRGKKRKKLLTFEGRGEGKVSSATFIINFVARSAGILYGGGGGRKKKGEAL